MKNLLAIPIVLAFAGATLATAHQLSYETADDRGLIFAAAFTVFALLLPAAGLLRDYGDRQLSRVAELVRAGASASTRSGLEAHSSLLRKLASKVWYLQWGIGFALAAALAGALSLIFPKILVWHQAPPWMTCSSQNLLSGAALVSLVATVLFTAPFTWRLLVKSDQLTTFADVADLALKTMPPATPTGVSAEAKGGGAVDVSWNAPSEDADVNGYVITPHLNQVSQATSEVASNQTSATITELTARCQYTFTVAAKNLYGFSPASLPSAVVTVT